MTIWNGITEQGSIVPIQVDAQGRVVISGGGGGQPTEVFGTAKAVGLFTSAGATTFALNCSCYRRDPGVYRVEFDTAFPNKNYVPLICAMEGAIRTPRIDVAFGDMVEFGLLENGSPSDTSFGIAVFDARPTDVTPLILPTSTVLEVQSLRAELEKLKKDKNH